MRACVCLSVDRGSAHLGYYLSMDSEGFDSKRRLTRLQGKDDWKLVIAAICDAIKRHETIAFEVVVLSAAV